MRPLFSVTELILGLLTLTSSGLLPVLAQVLPPVQPDFGVEAEPFDITQVTLNNGRWRENEARTLSYLKFIDLDRMLYVFRSNHKLSTQGALPNEGWDSPSFLFRSHMQGHMLSAWAQCYAVYKDISCRDRAEKFVAELQKCQENSVAAGFSLGYLSGFPESEFTRLEQHTQLNGNVPYYCIHKTMQGLLDVWRYIGDMNAQAVLLSKAAWVDNRTSAFDTSQMQTILGAAEFGGMADVLTDLYRQTSDVRWLNVAKRFDHAAVFDPLAANQDNLDGLHANTQVPKWTGAVREYMATGTSWYLDVAKNAWSIVVNHHSYAIGGNSQAEHFRAADAISNYLTDDACEHCNTVNLLKLTKQLWRTDPNSVYIDYFEHALMNHLLGSQNPQSAHGHITYFTPLNPGGHRGVGPQAAEGWSTDYTSFWCCQGTGVEHNTRLMDNIYGYNMSTLYVNLYAPSTLKWSQQDVTVTQITDFPVSDTSVLTIAGGGIFSMKLRIPAWTSGAKIWVNDEEQPIETTPGSYAAILRSWSSGDKVTIQLPMHLRLLPANDNKAVSAIAYGPAVLSGNYGDRNIASAPTLDLDTLKRTDNSSLAFTGEADGETVSIGPFYDAQNFNYVVYWAYNGSLPASG
jgi:DUF1680 family protein